MSLTLSPEEIVEQSESPLLACPNTWQRRPLGQVATILNGFAFKSKQFVPDEGMPLIRIRDISSDHTAVGYVGEYDERYIVHPDELLVGMDGDFNCARWRGPDALLNQRVCKITPKPDDLDINFLTFILPGYLQAIQDATSAVTVTHLSSRDIALIPIPVPPLQEQQQLASIFGSAARTTRFIASQLKTAHHAVEHFCQAVLAAAADGRLTKDWRIATVGEPEDGELPAGWTRTTVDELAEPGAAVSYGIVKPGPEVPGGVPYVRQQDIIDGTVLVDQLAHTSTELASKHQRTALRAGDVLLCIIRNLRVAIVPPGIDGANITQGMVRIRPGNRVLGEYLAYYLSAPSTQQRMRAQYVGLAMPRINVRDARELSVDVPPLDEQREIVNRVRQLFLLADELQQHIDTASRRADLTMQAVLGKAFRGELVASA